MRFPIFWYTFSVLKKAQRLFQVLFTIVQKAIPVSRIKMRPTEKAGVGNALTPQDWYNRISPFGKLEWDIYNENSDDCFRVNEPLAKEADRALSVERKTTLEKSEYGTETAMVNKSRERIHNPLFGYKKDRSEEISTDSASFYLNSIRTQIRPLWEGICTFLSDYSGNSTQPHPDVLPFQALKTNTNAKNTPQNETSTFLAQPVPKHKHPQIKYSIPTTTPPGSLYNSEKVKNSYTATIIDTIHKNTNPVNTYQINDMLSCKQPSPENSINKLFTQTPKEHFFSQQNTFPQTKQGVEQPGEYIPESTHKSFKKTAANKSPELNQPKTFLTNNNMPTNTAIQLRNVHSANEWPELTKPVDDNPLQRETDDDSTTINTNNFDKWPSLSNMPYVSSSPPSASNKQSNMSGGNLETEQQGILWSV